MNRKRNYSRLYAIAKAKSIDLEQHKEVLVSQFTGGRTSSLREMTPTEYEEMCECLQTGKQLGETSAAYKERLRKARSAALVPKLEAILRKPKPVKPQRVIPISYIVRPDQLPS